MLAEHKVHVFKRSYRATRFRRFRAARLEGRPEGHTDREERVTPLKRSQLIFLILEF